VSQGDILKDPWPSADVVVLVDVLHYFPAPLQQELLQRIAEHLGPGGALFLRVMDRDAPGRARFTRLLERAAVAIRWNQAADVHWRGLQEILDDLARFGLQPALCLSGAHFLDGNCLIAATKPQTSPSQRTPELGT
jgi:SAM-dependent methyltransferase